MNSIRPVKEKIAQAVSEKLGISVEAELIEFSNPKAGSHLALPCFRLAGGLGKSPQEIASQLAAELSIQHIDKVEAQGPYLNFWLEASYLSQTVAEQKETQMHDAQQNNKTVIVEFLSPNLAKPLSIGHLRNVLQGRALARVHQNAGFNVITDNHIGDWGTVFGMWVVGFQKFSSDEQLEQGGVEELGRMYVEMRQALKTEEDTSGSELADSVQAWLQKLESGDEEAKKYHERFSTISLAAITEQMAAMDVHFDHNYGESFYIERGKAIVQELVDAGQAIRNDDGSVIIPLDEQGIDVPMLIEKSNGASLYHTSDIATIEFREKEWSPDIVLYVVGSEQQFHFKQLFAANRKIGWTDAELIHHWYGLIEELDEAGKRRKMSSRSNAVYMKDLLQLARDKAREIAPDDMSDDDIDRIAQGALTFQEFSAGHTLNTLFDWDAMFSLSGFSGPYVQYAAVRINSLLAKANQAANYPENFDWSPYAKELWVLNKFQSVVDEATESRELHKLAEYTYELAKIWNKFYEKNPILQSEDDEKAARLWLAQTIGDYLTRSLYLLGIKIPSRM